MISNVNSLAIVTSSICEPRAIVMSHWSIILTLYLWTLSPSQWHCQPGRFSMAAHRHDRRGIYRCVLLQFHGRIEIDHSYGLRCHGLCSHSQHSTRGAGRSGRTTAGPTRAVPGVAAQTTPAPTVSWSIPILYAQVFLKRLIKNTYFFLIRLMEILWYNSAKSRFGSTSGSCSSMYSIHWSSRLCALFLIAGVSAFMLLMTSLWHLTVFRYVSRYVLYRDLCIEIRIVSWGTRIVTP